MRVFACQRRRRLTTSHKSCSSFIYSCRKLTRCCCVPAVNGRIFVAGGRAINNNDPIVTTEMLDPFMCGLDRCSHRSALFTALSSLLPT